MIRDETRSECLILFSMAIAALGIAGVIGACLQIFGNSYLHYSLFNLSLFLLLDHLKTALLLGSGFGICVILLSIPVLGRFRRKEPAVCTAVIMVCALLVAVIAGGYYLNVSDVFPPLRSPKGVIINIAYTLSLAVPGLIAVLRRERLHRMTSILTSRSRWIHGFTVIMILFTGLLQTLYSLREGRQGKQPSILLISLDTLRADHLSCYGYWRETSPVIDWFAREAVLFQNAMSHSSWTLPSHMSLFTSIYSSEHGYIREDAKLETGRKVPLLAELLKNRFYRTAAFTEGGLLDPTYGFGRGFDEYSLTRDHIRDPDMRPVLNFLNDLGGKPFFLFLHTYTIHNYYSPEEYRKLYDPECDGRFHKWDEAHQFLQLYLDADLRGKEAKKKLRHMVNLYDASIRYVDSRLGFLLGKLREMGLYDDMIIIITSDHGEEFGDHGHSFHGSTLYRELISVPLIIRFPRGEYGGSRRDIIVRHVDVVPTLLDYLGDERGAWMRGTSLMPIIRGETVEQRSVYSDLLNKKVLKFSLRTYRYHLIYESELKGLPDEEMGNYLLFDIENDPTEQVDISSIDEEVFKSMRDRLRGMIFRMIPGTSTRLKELELDKGLKERLSGLGYLQ